MQRRGFRNLTFHPCFDFLDQELISKAGSGTFGFVSEKEQGISWLHNDLRNCHPNAEGGLSATDAGILLFNTLLHKHARRHCVKTSGPSLDTAPCWYCRSKDLWTCTFISCTGDGMWCDGLQKLLKCLHFDVAKRWGGEGRGQRGIKTTKTPSRTTRV